MVLIRNMVRVGKPVDYGVVILIHMAMSNEKELSARLISDATNISLPMTQKVLKLLSAAKLVVAKVGSRGGYRLMRDIESISLADVFDALKTKEKDEIRCCKANKRKPCDRSKCLHKGHWFEVDQIIKETLKNYHLGRVLNKQEITSEKVGVL